MKKTAFLYIALGSLITILYNKFIDPLLDIIYGDNANQFSLRATKIQCELNEINRNEQIKQEKFEAPLSNPIGFVHPNTEIEYEDEDDDYEN